MRMLAVALLVVLAGCGGGSSDGAAAVKKSSSAPTVAATTPEPTVAPPTGTPMPESLSRFRCDKDAKGVWSTSGFLANRTKAKVTFQVTVYVGEATGGREKAKTRQVPNVAAGGSARFSITKLPAPKGDAACHVQVLAHR